MSKEKINPVLLDTLLTSFYYMSKSVEKNIADLKKEIKELNQEYNTGLKKVRS